MTQAYPLHWPPGAPRTKSPARSAFGEVSIHRAAKELMWEIERMRGSLPVVSTNLALRGDGLPYSKQARIDDNGVAIYFTRRGRQLVFACDRWDRIEHNMRALGRKSVANAKLRTERLPGHVEIVRDHRTGQWIKITYDEQVAA